MFMIVKYHRECSPNAYIYGILAWGHTALSERSKTYLLQKRSIRIICKAKYKAHTTPLFKYCTILKLCDLYRQQAMLFAASHRNPSKNVSGNPTGIPLGIPLGNLVGICWDPTEIGGGIPNLDMEFFSHFWKKK